MRALQERIFHNFLAFNIINRDWLANVPSIIRQILFLFYKPKSFKFLQQSVYHFHLNFVPCGSGTIFWNILSQIPNFLRSNFCQITIVDKFPNTNYNAWLSGGQASWLIGRSADSDSISDQWSNFQNIAIFRKKFRKGLNQNIDQKADIWSKP